ncbi:hypothetical protein CK203_104211 [Vitis vinifera]|uniref:DUF4283 domain-containing protein n=1 Tax=Vitis vinifera TaxID=29760 RepID=A0A438BMW3_VITVI|nr:hypothetical protein CK203_104211 [Vitis vinifera]
MGESTQEDFVPHSWTCGGRRVERDRSTTDGNSSVGAVGKMKKGGESQKVETIPVGTHGKRGLEVVNSWFLPSSSSILNSNKQRLGPVGLKQGENFNEQSVLPALIEVLDEGWVFTISIVVVEVEEVRQGREMGESTREDFMPHSWTCGGRWVKRDRSTIDGSSFVGAVGKMNKGGEIQKAETIPVGTHGKKGPEVVNSWFLTSSSSILNSNKRRLGPVRLEQVGKAWAEWDKAYSNDEEGHRASNSKQERRAQSPLNLNPLGLRDERGEFWFKEVVDYSFSSKFWSPTGVSKLKRASNT